MAHGIFSELFGTVRFGPFAIAFVKVTRILTSVNWSPKEHFVANRESEDLCGLGGSRVYNGVWV